jgi:hypothetical protein
MVSWPVPPGQYCLVFPKRQAKPFSTSVSFWIQYPSWVVGYPIADTPASMPAKSVGGRSWRLFWRVTWRLLALKQHRALPRRPKARVLAARSSCRYVRSAAHLCPLLCRHAESPIAQADRPWRRPKEQDCWRCSQRDRPHGRIRAAAKEAAGTEREASTKAGPQSEAAEVIVSCRRACGHPSTCRYCRVRKSNEAAT